MWLAVSCCGGNRYQNMGHTHTHNLLADAQARLQQWALWTVTSGADLVGDRTPATAASSVPNNDASISPFAGRFIARCGLKSAGDGFNIGSINCLDAAVWLQNMGGLSPISQNMAGMCPSPGFPPMVSWMKSWEACALKCLFINWLPVKHLNVMLND